MGKFAAGFHGALRSQLYVKAFNSNHFNISFKKIVLGSYAENLDA
jgi:hypothetical protein